MTLEEALSEKYAIIAQHPFKQRLINGELTVIEYLIYLAQIQPLYNHMERYPLPNDEIQREQRAVVDMIELRNYPENLFNPLAKPLQTTYHYMQYILKLSEEKTKPHAYVNYMFLLTEGQTYKDKIPGSGRVYKFDDVDGYINLFESTKQDDWAEEANIALDYYIAIFDELQELIDSFNELNNKL
jgi:thiaminase